MAGWLTGWLAGWLAVRLGRDGVCKHRPVPSLSDAQKHRYSTCNPQQIWSLTRRLCRAGSVWSSPASLTIGLNMLPDMWPTSRAQGHRASGRPDLPVFRESFAAGPQSPPSTPSRPSLSYPLLRISESRFPWETSCGPRNSTA